MYRKTFVWGFFCTGRGQVSPSHPDGRDFTKNIIRHLRFRTNLPSMVKSADKNCLFLINLTYPDIISGNHGDPKESVYWGQYHPYLRSVDAYVCPNF